MANIFLNLPMPAGDGAGASIDTSAMGGEKSIVIGGSFTGSSVVVEASTDGAEFAPICLFTSAGKKVIEVAAQFMRVNVLGRSAEPFSATANVGANDAGALFAALPLPAGDGAGAAVDVSALGNFTTFIVGGSLRGAGIAIQVSEDGVDYADCESFSGVGGLKSKVVVANFMRTFVKGRVGNTHPYTAAVSVGAVVDGGVGTTGETFINTLRGGEGDSHDSATPLVVSQFEFNPLDYDLSNATRSIKFRAVAANGGGVASTNVQLYNITDDEVITTLNFTSATPALVEAVLTEGTGAGEIDLSSKIYEVRIFVDAPDALDDTIELGSAELQIINTID